MGVHCKRVGIADVRVVNSSIPDDGLGL